MQSYTRLPCTPRFPKCLQHFQGTATAFCFFSFLPLLSELAFQEFFSIGNLQRGENEPSKGR